MPAEASCVLMESTELGSKQELEIWRDESAPISRGVLQSPFARFWNSRRRDFEFRLWPAMEHERKQPSHRPRSPLHLLDIAHRCDVELKHACYSSIHLIN